MSSLTERYATQIKGTLACFDRIVLTGNLPGICYASGMERYLRSRHILLTDYPRFAEPFRDAVRTTIETAAQEAGIPIEFVRSPKGFRKENRVQEVLRERGVTTGLVHILSAMEACPSYAYRYDKASGRSWLQGREGKCGCGVFWRTAIGRLSMPTVVVNVNSVCMDTGKQSKRTLP